MASRPDDDLIHAVAQLGRRAVGTTAYAHVGRPLTIEHLGELPITEKADVRNDLARYQTVLSDRAALLVTSSGTTGAPAAYRRSSQEMAGNAEAVADRLRSALPGSHRMLSLLDHNRFAVGPLIESVSSVLHAPLHRGFPYRAGALDAEAVATAITAYDLDIVVATPGIAIDLEDAWDRRGVDIGAITDSVRSVLMLGQTVTQGLRRHVSDVWSADARIFSYGSSETGTIATGCRNGLMHAIDERFVLEVRTAEQVVPLAVAERGELVVTPLHADVTMLLRYATGDTVRRVRCDCGTVGTAFVVEGRADDVVNGPDGPLGAEEVEAAVYEVPDVIDYLLDIDQREHVRQVRLLVRRGCSAPDTTLLAATLGAPAVIVDEIPAAARAGALVKSWRMTRTVQKFWSNR